MVPDYKAGASGKIAMRAAATAAPDGYTIVNANVGSAASNMGYFSAESNGYDTEKDFEAISYTMIAPIILVVNKDLQFGATVLHLTERPLTNKIIIGDESNDNKLSNFDDVSDSKCSGSDGS